MIISTFKKLLLVGSVSLCMTAMAMPTNLSCSCSETKAIDSSCAVQTVDGPSWWGWLTKNRSSQFHFFDLVELLNNSDKLVTTDKTKLDKADS